MAQLSIWKHHLVHYKRLGNFTPGQAWESNVLFFNTTLKIASRTNFESGPQFAEEHCSVVQCFFLLGVDTYTRLPLGAKFGSVREDETKDKAGNLAVLFRLSCCCSWRILGPTAEWWLPLRRPMLAARRAREWGCCIRSSDRGPRLSGRPWLPKKITKYCINCRYTYHK